MYAHIYLNILFLLLSQISAKMLSAFDFSFKRQVNTLGVTVFVIKEESLKKGKYIKSTDQHFS
jgi:hypothetical protein